VSLDETQARQFSHKLKEFRKTLTDEEKPVFDAILNIAWHISAKEEDLGQEFDGCFSSEEAELILAYRAGNLDLLAGMVKGDLIRTSASLIRTLIQTTPNP